MASDKAIARALLNEQGFDVDEDRIAIPSKRCDMDLKRKTQNDKHNILADLVQTDGSIDGEKLMEKLSKGDSVNHPSYYNQGKIEVIDFIEDKHLDFHRANACKYLCRAGLKSRETRIEDLKKARWYIDRLIHIWELEDNK